jgi:DNA-binding transcriptional LysR family regulator
MRRTETISRRVKLRHLNVLVAVVEQRSMVNAAERLGVSQPVVSKAIADLEHLVGVRLLDRGPQGVEPTVYGRALLKRSVSILDDLRSSIDELEFLAAPGAGELRIGSTEAMGTTLVPAVINRLARRYPRILFEVVLADPDTLLNRDLRGRRVDLIAGPFTPDTDDDLDVTVLHHDRLHVVCGPESPWANRRKISLADLVGERWVLPPPSHPIGSLVVNAFRHEGLQAPTTVVTVTSARFTTSLIAAGEFLGVLASAGLNDPYTPLRTLPVELPMATWPLSVAALKGRTIGPMANLFLECASELVRPLAKAAGRRRIRN